MRKDNAFFSVIMRKVGEISRTIATLCYTCLTPEATDTRFLTEKWGKNVFQGRGNLCQLKELRKKTFVNCRPIHLEVLAIIFSFIVLFYDVPPALPNRLRSMMMEAVCIWPG